MKYAIVFGILASLLAWKALSEGQWFLLLLWPALSFGIFSAGYAGLGPLIFAKRSNGSYPLWSIVLMLPLFALIWTAWHAKRLLDGDLSANEVRPGVWLGRRPLFRDIPEGVKHVIDLTAEMFPARKIRTLNYHCLPTLDMSVPETEAFEQLLNQVLNLNEPVYIHCAQGHGRSAMFVAAMLVRQGICATPREAMAYLRQRRRVGLNEVQRRFLEEFFDPARQTQEKVLEWK
jgi:protein-tyrosine phosphatase